MAKKSAKKNSLRSKILLAGLACQHLPSSSDKILLGLGGNFYILNFFALGVQMLIKF